MYLEFWNWEPNLDKILIKVWIIGDTMKQHSFTDININQVLFIVM